MQFDFVKPVGERKILYHRFEFAKLHADANKQI